eukprot:TRINITY_DN1693_c0_g3_i3.p1 TRINITY_DN1693_c0_g3~~TRINITY_DN1693_c0_g3_i3.p1  ORF type:complete len:272 (+),score=36.49 TRINITY_DN1693_c0_g3_i3:35-850(+)
MISDPKAVVTPGGICLSTEEDGKKIGVISITSQEASRTLLFKLKTSAPQKYVVKQSVGMLTPGQTREITVRPKTGDNGDDKFQLEIRTVTQSEQDTLENHRKPGRTTRDEAEERDGIGKMWKAADGGVAKLQYLLLIQDRDCVTAVAVPKKKATDANREYQARTSDRPDTMTSILDENQRLIRERNEASAQIATLVEANAANGKDTSKSAKTPPLTIPLWLSVVLVVASFGLGLYISYAAQNDSRLTPSPLLAQYLEYLQRPFQASDGTDM